MAQPGFIFGGNTGISYDELQQRRKVLDAMLGRQSAPQNVGEGIFALTQGLVGGLEARGLRQAEEAGRKRSDNAFSSAMSAIGMPGSSGQLASPIEPVAAPSMASASSPASGARAAADVKSAAGEDYVMNYLIGKGLAPHQAAGFTGNLIQESSLNTGARNRGDGRDGSDSIGIAQWNGDRARNLQAFAQGTGRDATNIDTQLDFALHEMGLGNQEWSKLPGWGAEGSAGRALRGAQDVAGAAAAGISYERPAGWSTANPTGGHGWDNRYGHANRLASAGYGAQQQQASPVQVASNDPTAGVAAATAPQTPVQTVAAAMPQQQAPAPSQAVQRVAQAMPQMPQAPSNSIPPEALQALQDPYLTDGQRQALQIALQQRAAGNTALYERQMMAYEQQRDAILLEQKRAYDENVRQQGFAREDAIRREGYGREDAKAATAQANNDRDFAYKVEQGNKPPTSIQEYEYARAQGFQGTFAEYEQANRKASATNVNLPGQPNIGTIPQGYQAIKDETTGQWTMSRIPGGPEDDAKSNAKKADNQEISTGIVTTAAARAREALNAAGLPATGSVGGVLAALPESNAAELRRQVAVLQANAKVENLTAMRAASPTGAALGAVSDSENAMLAAKSGTLDPSSPNFARDLDDYERTLLRIVHGAKVGDAIFEQTRGGSANGPAVAERRPNIVPGSDAGQRYEGGVPVGGMSQAGMSAPAPVQVKSPEEFNALPPGALFIAPDGTTRRKPNG